MHCFSGSKELAEQCIRLGFHGSFAGNVTYPNAHKLHEIAKWMDLRSILLETDSPWLAPQAMRGKRNEPSFLPFIAKKIAGLKGVSLDDLAAATTKNAEAIFRIK
jgi:TatD DNase family protein